MDIVMRHRPRIEDVLPLTPLQEGLLFHASYDADTPDVYAVQTVIHLTGPVRADRLRDAIAHLLERRPALRASFRVLEQRGPVQVIQSAVRLPWRELDLSAAPAARSEQDAAAVALEERVRRFALDSAPLIRFTLLRLGGERWRFVVTHHHVLLDGWSMPLLLGELFRHYADGTPLDPGTTARAYFDWLDRQDPNRTRAAWREALAGLDEGTQLGGDADVRSSVEPDEVVLRLPREVTSHLVEGSRRLGVTLNTVVQAAWALLLAEWTGRDDVVFGATTAGRPAEVPGITTQLGLFVNTLPVRVRLDPARPVGSLLDGLQAQQAELSVHQTIGLADVQRLAAVEGDLFDTVVVFENYPLEGGLLELPDGLRVSGTSGVSTTHYPLGLMVLPGPELVLALGFRPDVFERSRVRRYATRLSHLLVVLATADAALPLGRLDLLDEAEHARLAAVPAAPPATIPPGTVIARFAEQVALRPDEVAVAHDNATLTYAELSGLVESVAGHLRDLAIGPEDLVAVAVRRGPEMVAAVLGVLAVGAAYLPIDPAYPPDRIDQMLADAHPALLVTTESTAKELPPAGGVPRTLLPASAITT